MIRALILWLVLAGPALATQQGWPALFDVTGVAPDDVLNIREAPNAGAPIIGSFAPDAEGVEVIRPNADESWGLVNTAEGTGWTSLAFLERRPGQWNGAFPRIARCLGTEPFWSLSLDEDAVTLSTPQETAEGRVALRSGAAARRDRFGFRTVNGEPSVGRPG